MLARARRASNSTDACAVAARVASHRHVSTSASSNDASGSSGSVLDALLERKRRERATSGHGDAREAIARARSAAELRTATEGKVDGRAAALALERCAKAKSSVRSVMGEGFVGIASEALRRDARRMSVHAVGGVFHDADVARFDALPSGELLRAAAERLESERGLVAADAVRVIWGVANFYKRRGVDSGEVEDAMRAFVRAATEATPRVFDSWDAKRDPRRASTLCRALKHLIEINRMVGQTPPAATIESLVRVGARNAGSMSPAQVSFILHDVVSAGAMEVLSESLMEAFTSSIDVDLDAPLEFSTVSALLWCYGKMDASRRGLVSRTHLDNMHYATITELESDGDLLPRDIALNLYATARLGEAHIGFKDAAYHNAAARRLLEGLDGLNKQALCMICWSLNVMRPNEEDAFIWSTFLQAVVEAVKRSVHDFSPHELAPTMHALTSLHAASAKLLELARDQFSADVYEYAANPQNIVLMLWSFAAAEYDVGDVALKNAARAFVDASESASAQELKTALQSLARLHYVFDQDTVALEHARMALEKAIDRVLDEYSQGECEILAWSLLATRVPASERLLERVGVAPVANDAGDVEYIVNDPNVDAH